MAAAGASKQEIKAANPGLSKQEIKAAINPTPSSGGGSKYNNPVQKAVATYTGDSGWDTGSKRFGGGDIKALQGRGYSPNQIMKIAAGIGNMAGVSNRANTMLTAGFPNATKSGKNGLSASYFANTSDPLMQGLARQSGYSPNKKLTWGGITAEGKPLALSGMDYSKGLYGKGSAYTWTPGKGLGEKAMDKLVNAKDAGPYDGMEIKPFDPNGPGPLAPTTDTPVEPILPEKEEEEDPMMMPGVGADVSSFATGWKSRLSSRKGRGAAAQGLASQRLGPVGKWQYNV
jgi:hypothetical protein